MNLYVAKLCYGDFTFFGQPFGFASDDHALKSFDEAVSGDSGYKLDEVWLVGKFDPITGIISDVNSRKEIYNASKKVVNETQPEEV